MKRGFLNNKQAKAVRVAPRGTCILQVAICVLICIYTEVTIPAEQYIGPPLEYGVVPDAGKSSRITLLPYRRLIPRKGRPEGYSTRPMTYAEQDATAHPDSFPPDSWLYTTQPPANMGDKLADFPDGWTECMVTPAVKKAIITTPGFPQPVPRPSTRNYRIAESPGKGLAMFSTRKLVLGDLILAERPMIMFPGVINVGIQFPDHFTQRQKTQALLYEWEEKLDLAFKRMPEEYQEAYLALANSHQHDGSRPITGIGRTNGFGVTSFGELVLSAVCRDASRLNHRSAIIFCFLLNRSVSISIFFCSCSPNVTRHFDPRSFSYKFYAIRDIAKGEELTTPYCDITASFESRKKSLAPYGFECTCDACRDPASSDPRRLGLKTANLPEWLSILALPDDCLVKDSVRQLSIMWKEGMESDALYLDHMRAVMEAYICLGDENNAFIYGRKAAKLLFVDKGDASSIEHYLTPETIRSHPMWELRVKSKAALALAGK